MTITTKDARATRNNFSMASLHVKSKVINGRVYWYGENEADGLSWKKREVSEWRRISKAAAAEILAKYGITLEQFHAYERGELEIVEVSEETTSEAANVEEETKYFYTTNRGNVYEVKIGETGSTVRSRWYYYHEIAGLSEQAVIELTDKEIDGNDFANLLCKFIATETDGSEDDSNEEIFSLLPVDKIEDDETDETAPIETVEEIIYQNHELVNINATKTSVNGEEIISYKGKPLVIYSKKYGAKIQFLPNGEIAYYTNPATNTGFDFADVDRWDVDEFFAIMAKRGVCAINDGNTIDEKSAERDAQIEKLNSDNEKIAREIVSLKNNIGRIEQLISRAEFELSQHTEFDKSYLTAQNGRAFYLQELELLPLMLERYTDRLKFLIEQHDAGKRKLDSLRGKSNPPFLKPKETCRKAG